MARPRYWRPANPGRCFGNCPKHCDRSPEWHARKRSKDAAFRSKVNQQANASLPSRGWFR